MNKFYLIASLMLCISTGASALVPPEGVNQMIYTVESTSPTPIYQATIVPLTSGYWALSENITTGINIASSNVTLDLNGYTVTNPTGDGITVAPGVNNVEIYNGTVGPVVPTSSVITLTNNASVFVHDCVLTEGLFGLVSINSSALTVKNCLIEKVAGGVALALCENTFLKSCQIKNISHETDDVVGVYANNCTGVIVEDCLVEDVLTNGTSHYAVGCQFDNSSIGCIVKNCMVSDVFATVTDALAYGIQSLDSFSELTGCRIAPQETVLQAARSIDWHPTGNWVAVSSVSYVYIYSFDGTSYAQTDSAPHGAQINSVAWSPDGAYLAIGGEVASPAYNVRVYSFNTISGTLGLSPDPLLYALDINQVAWHPSGKYLALAADLGSPAVDELAVYSYIANTFTQIDTAPHTEDLFSVAWHPSGQYLAVGGDVSSPAFTVRIFTFDSATLTDIIDLYPYTESRIWTVGWSSDGQYLAAGSNFDANSLFVYSFNGVSAALVDFSGDYGAAIRSLEWHPTNQYIAVGGNDEGSPGVTNFTIFALQGGALERLTDYDVDHGAEVRSVSWSKQLEAVTFCGGVSGIYTGRAYTNEPRNCIIKDNIVSRVQTSYGKGEGIDVSPMWHTVASNKAYSNDFNYNLDMTDIYTGGMSGTPGSLQNISL